MIKKTMAVLFLAVSMAAQAQVQTPQPSPAASVSTVVGLTNVKVDYFRPRVKGRKIFGEKDVLHPHGQIWRTGANSGTKISFSDDLTVEGIKVAKGEYLIFTWPGATEWTVSLYKDLSIGGDTDAYKAENEVAKFKVKPGKLAEKVEMLTINIADISDDNKTAKIELAWENTSVKFGITVDFDSKVMKSIETSTRVNPSNYANAAIYYAENGKDLNQALTWIGEAIKANPKAFWYIHQKAKIQAKMGDMKGAKETAAESIRLAKENGNDFGYIKLNEDLLKTLK